MHSAALAHTIEAEAEAPRQTPVSDWVKQALSPGTIITLVGIAIAFGSQAGRTSTQIDGLSARVEKMESSYVPRSEHATKDQYLRDELHDIKRQLDLIYSTLLRAKN